MKKNFYNWSWYKSDGKLTLMIWAILFAAPYIGVLIGTIDLVTAVLWDTFVVVLGLGAMLLNRNYYNKSIRGKNGWL